MGRKRCTAAALISVAAILTALQLGKLSTLTSQATQEVFSYSASTHRTSSARKKQTQLHHGISSLETTVECKGYCCHSLSVNNRSCHYTNLYLERSDGQFWAFVVSGSDSEAAFIDRSALAVAQETRTSCRGPFPPNVSAVGFRPLRTMCSTDNLDRGGNGTVLYGETMGGFASLLGENTGSDKGLPIIHAGPMLKVFSSHADLREHVAIMERHDALETRPHVHVQYPPSPNENWGHHVMDNMYASWMATSKFGLENQTMCFVSAPRARGNGTSRSLPPEMDPMATFGGCPSTYWEELIDRTGRTDTWVRFDHWVFGISSHGMMHRTHHYEASLFQNEEDAAIHFPALFRHRMYTRYEIEAPVLRTVSNERRRWRRISNESDELVLNALIVPNKRFWGNLTAMAKKINEQLRRIEVAGRFVSISAEVFDWRSQNTMTKQLSIMRETDIYVSSIGTALTLQIFLPDGSVVINVGYDSGYWDEYITAACRWLDAVYPSQLKTERTEKEITDLVLEASTKIIAGFDIPLPRGKALSPYGKSFSEFLRSKEAEDLHAWQMLNTQYQWDDGYGWNSGGCVKMLGHAAAAFYWVCGWLVLNNRCHPTKDYMARIRQKHNASCPVGSLINFGRVSVKRPPEGQEANLIDVLTNMNPTNS